jgi:uncharacterized PurR-regulated membrane protein YhhQ (DUF165 family)
MATFVVGLTNFIGVKLFHFRRRVTQGRHLWLRNNASTMTSQLVDMIINSIFLGFGLGERYWTEYRSRIWALVPVGFEIK